MASLCSAVVLATLVAAAGCAADSGDNALLILANKAPEEGCAFDNSTTGAVFDSGRYDVYLLDPQSSSGAFLAAPLVQNLTLVNEASAPELIARRTALMKGVHVSISFTDDTLFPAAEVAALKTAGLLQFDARFAGTIEPNLGTGVFPVEVVPNALLQKIKTVIAAQPTEVHVGLIVSLSAYGELGGSTVDSAPFDLPIDICNGCLTQILGPCDALPESVMPRTGGACDVRQDGAVDCCTVEGGYVCPAVGTGGTV